MKNLRKVWTIIFLVLTGGALGMELWAGLDSSSTTVPWTELISGYVPQPITLTALAVLSTWLPVHFAHHYVGSAPEQRYTKTLVTALTAGFVALGAALTDDHVTRPELLAVLAAIATGLGVYATPNGEQPPKDEAVDYLRAQQEVPRR
jgi:hypothetical protein